MGLHALKMIRYENHLQTLRSLGLPIKGFAVFDATGSCLWSDRDDPGAEPGMLEALHLLDQRETLSDEAARFVSGDLPEGGQVFAAYVDDARDGRLLVFVMITRPEKRLNEDGINRVELAALAVSANILSEFQLTRELETRSDALAERHDALDRAFRSDQPSHNTLYGFEALRQVIRDTTEFLGAGLAALLLPSKDLEVYDLDDQLSVADAPRLLTALRDRWMDDLRGHETPIVVNNVRDRVRHGLKPGLPCKLMIFPVPARSGDAAALLVVANNEEMGDFAADELNQGEAMARKVSKVLQLNFDPLTGLENSHSFEWSVGQALMQACSRGQKHAILHVGIDRTAVVNEISGPEAGDAMIRVVAGILADSLRAHDSIARIAGDHFGILLESCSIESAAMLAEKISRRVSTTNFEWAGTMHPLSVCIGIAPITAHSESVTAILNAVSVACDAAREAGRGRVQIYEQADIDLLRRRGEFQWVGRVQSALSEDRFELHAQAITHVATEQGGALPHFEVLVRMRDDKGELVAPASFMPAAEHYLLMPDVDRWVVGKVIDRLLATSEQCGRPPMRLSVNISGQSLSDEPFRTFVGAQLQRLGGLAEYLGFEISEAAAVTSMDDALEFIDAVKDFGCKISLDDVGNGTGSFACLQRLGVDYLKIDGAHVCCADTDRVAASVVAAINQVGHALGMKTIAESVENDAIAREMTKIGTDFAQGYHFARPRPLTDLLQELTRARVAVNG